MRSTYHTSWGRFKVMLPLISSRKHIYPKVANVTYKVVTIPMPIFNAWGKRFDSFIWFSSGRTYKENVGNTSHLKWSVIYTQVFCVIYTQINLSIVYMQMLLPFKKHIINYWIFFLVLYILFTLQIFKSLKRSEISSY